MVLTTPDWHGGGVRANRCIGPWMMMMMLEWLVLPNHEEGISKLHDAIVRSERLAVLILEKTTATTSQRQHQQSCGKIRHCFNKRRCCCCCSMAVGGASGAVLWRVLAAPANALVGSLDLAYPRLMMHAVGSSSESNSYHAA